MDVRKLKVALRRKHKATRRGFTNQEKSQKDNQILQKLISTQDYIKADMVLAFVSNAIEVDTINLIKKAWEDGKKVAVPRCMNDRGLMDFYYINSMEDLELGSFALQEPSITKCEKITECDNSICIVPALAFDKMGYRLGYGKGYYDRFLAKYQGVKIGICYSDCMEIMLPYGKYDVVVDYIITDK